MTTSISCRHLVATLLIIFPVEIFSQTNGTYCNGETRSDCFLGSCPSGYQCISEKCCSTKDVVKPGGDCRDYLSDCFNIDCKAVGVQDFARANCARTCNLCYDAGPINPKYACIDLLDDCSTRIGLCQDIDFVDMMALFCPRTCDLCLWPEATTISNCGNQLHDCSNRTNFCTGTATSAYQKRVGCGLTCGLCGALPVTTPTSRSMFNLFGV